MSRATAVSVAIVAVAVLAFTLSFGLPGYSQGGPQGRDVRVINGPAEAVPVRVTQLPPAAGVQPWQQAMSLDLGDGQTSSQLLFNIPSGKRLVLEHVSAGLVVMPEQTPVVFFWADNPSASTVPHTVHIANVGPWGNSIQSRWTGSHPMKVYLDSGILRVSRAGGVNGPLFASVTLSGYLVDLP